MACSKFDFGELPSDWWWYIVSSAFELILHKLPPYSSYDGYCGLQVLSDSCFMIDDVDVLGELDSGTIHRPVLVHLLPVSISIHLYLTSTPIPHFVNDTSYPASHSFTTEMSEYDAKSGMIWHTLALWAVVAYPGRLCVWSVPGHCMEVWLILGQLPPACWYKRIYD